MTLQFEGGEQEEEEEEEEEEMWGRLHLRKRLARCDFYHFTEDDAGGGDVSCFVVRLSPVNYTFRIY